METLYTVLYIALAIFMFGLLIFVHELGHFLAARLFKVKVNEFALGMGPAIFKKKKGDTLYALRLLPIGGFCAMEGEDEDSPAPDAFGNKPIWQRCIILVAGATMNLIAGLVILLIVYVPTKVEYYPQISNFAEGFPYSNEEMLMVGDTITKINGYNIYTYGDVELFLEHDADKPYNFTVKRDGKVLELYGVPLARAMYPTEIVEDGVVRVEDRMRFGIVFSRRDVGFFGKVRMAFMEALDFVRLIKVSIFDIFSGKAGVSDLTGPVGITSLVSNSARVSLSAMWRIVALITINLAVMNLLPLPALDGGRVVFLVIEKLRGKPVSAKYEGAVHLVGLMAFFGLMLFVSFNDVMRLING